MFEQDDPFKVDKSLKLLELDIDKDKKYVLNEISKYLFNPKSGGRGNSEKHFDLNHDYKYYFVDFIRMGINLNHQDIDWWEFISILDGIMLDEEATISKVIGYRTYTKPSSSTKTQEEKRHRFMMKMKQKYSLPIPQNERGFDKMWSYLEKKVGDKNE